jgi:hypothetical protein
MVRIQQGLEIFLVRKATTPALGIIQPPIKWVPRYFCGIKLPGRDVEVYIYTFMA